MAQSFISNATDCFPQIPDDASLPEVINESDIQSDIEDARQSILKLIDRYFPAGGLVAHRHPINNELVDDLFDQILKTATTVTLYGELRSIRQQISTLIDRATLNHSMHHKGASIYTPVALDIKEHFVRASWKYAMKIKPLQPGHVQQKHTPQTAMDAGRDRSSKSDSVLSVPVEKRIMNEPHIASRPPIERDPLESVPDEAVSAAIPAGLSVVPCTCAADCKGSCCSEAPLEPAPCVEIPSWEPAAVLQHLHTVTQESGGDEAAMRALVEARGIPWETFCLWREQESDYILAAKMLTVLAEDGNLPRGEYEHASKTLLNILFAGIRQVVVSDIAIGNSVFGPDETEVAFVQQLKEYKLWSTYEKLKKPKTPPVSKAKPVPPSFKPVPASQSAASQGRTAPRSSQNFFTPEESELFSKADQKKVNELFDQLPDGSWEPEHVSTHTAFILCEIAKILLMYMDSMNEHLLRRIGLKEAMFWKILDRHTFSLLAAEDFAALFSLGNEIYQVGHLQSFARDQFEYRRDEIKGRVALYRRLVRFEHAASMQEKIDEVARVLLVSPDELKKWEYRNFTGLSKQDLAPDLFPVPSSDSAGDQSSRAG